MLVVVVPLSSVWSLRKDFGMASVSLRLMTYSILVFQRNDLSTCECSSHFLRMVVSTVQDSLMTKKPGFSTTGIGGISAPASSSSGSVPSFT